MTTVENHSETPLFSRLAPVRDLPSLEGRKITHVATEEERAAVAAALDFLKLDDLTVEARLIRWGAKGWRAAGRVFASGTQECVVTLAPVAASVDETFDRVFDPAAEPDQPGSEVEVDYSSDDPPEPLGAGVDLGAIGIEHLALGVDPYPRARGASFAAKSAAPAGVAPLTDDAVKPFAGLEKLKRSNDGGD